MPTVSSADCLTDDLIAHVISFLTSPADISTASLLNKQWYAADAATRRSVKVRHCLAVSPTILTRRFRALKSVTLVGRPDELCISSFQLYHRSCDYSQRWIECLAASSYAGGLEELRLKRFVLSHALLLIIAQSFPNLRSLSFVECSGVFNSGFADILRICRLLRELEVDGCGLSLSFGYDPRSSSFFDCCESLESFTFVNSRGVVFDTTVLENLVSRCPNLKCLRIDELLGAVEVTRILEATPQLVELGFATRFPLEGGVRARFEDAVISCMSLQRLSGNWLPRNLILLKPLCSKLLFLDLMSVYPRRKSRASVAGFIKECVNLQCLWVHISVGDNVLHVVGEACKKLQELKVIADNRQTRTVTVTEAALAAIAKGCIMLRSVTFGCSSMSNAALLTFAQQNPGIRRFKLVLQENLARESFDEGIGSILRCCKNLNKLAVYGAYVTDHVFFLAGMFGAQLRKLSLPLSGKNNGGVFYALNLCPNLRQLVIRGTMDKAPFGDDAILAVAAAEKFKNLQYVYFGSTKVTERGFRILREAYPTVSADIMNDGHNLLIYHRLEEY